MLQESPVKAPPTDTELACALGVHRTQIGRWRKAGCPTQSVEAVKEWRSKYPGAQQRFNNKNGVGNNLAKRVERLGLSPPRPARGPRMTAELLKQVAECFFNGFNDEETACLCDLEESTVRAWRKLAPIKKAELQRKNHYIERVRDGTRPDWARICWWLERRYPLEFSRPEVAHAIRVSNQTTTNVTNNLVISSEIAKELTARSKSVRAEVNKLFSNYTAPAANQPRALPDRDRDGQDVPG
jgi:hypothetical protein